MHRIGRCIGSRLGRLFGQRSWMSEPGEQAPKRIKLDAQDVLPPPAHDKMPRFDRGVFLAPMVRSGALPCRLLALEYGADLVWGPEVVDRAIMGAERRVHPSTGLVEFMKDGKQVF